MRKRLAANFAIATMTIALITLLFACGKSGGGSSTPEPTLAVTLTPAAGSTQAPSVGPFTVNVKITSTMPAKGVSIAVSASPDGSSTNFFSTTANSTTASNDFTITNTPKGQICVVKVTVTSLSTSTNTWTGSYRYSAK